MSYSNHPEARGELKRLLGAVGHPSLLHRRIEYEEDAEQYPVDSPQRRRIERAMRRDEPPTTAQTVAKAVLGLGVVAGLTAITLYSGIQTWDHFHAYQSSGGDFMKTLTKGELSINWLHNLGHEFGTQATNFTQTVLFGAGTITGASVDFALILNKPWKKPKRRGIF